MRSAPRAIAVGKFDALHVGHRRLVETARTIAEPLVLRLSGFAAAFGWAPRLPLVADAERPRVLATWATAELCLDIAAIRDWDAAAFLDWLVERCTARALVVGPGFRCGRGRSAGIRELAPLAAARGLLLAVAPPARVAGKAVSSSRVRRALARGALDLVSRCLDRRYRLLGTVVRGDGRGRQLGFPTANLGALANQPPAAGVYAALAELGGQRWPAAVMIGSLPTLGIRRPRIEAHLIGFAGDCYGQPLALEFLARLRPARRFPSLTALVEQVARDIAEAARLAQLASGR
ncbi:MAG: riboflavin kinase [Planctomycetota bacterium]|nr:bifunctional riboflavin kinase/FAD synthetase [Planctomycetota bacterium]MDW8372130.1 riboflavin kinase [Planctomycetota bacterium]